MRRYLVMYKSAILIAILGMVISTSCNAKFAGKSTLTITPTSSPEPLQLINGIIDACLLLTPEEVETILGNEVTSEVVYPIGRTGCKYVSVIDEEAVLQVYAITDTTVKQDEYLVSININSAAEDYESIKTGNLDFAQKLSGLKIEFIDKFGDQAYMSVGSFISLHVLNNDIYYEFTTYVDDGIGSDGLRKLAQIAMHRMP